MKLILKISIFISLNILTTACSFGAALTEQQRWDRLSNAQKLAAIHAREQESNQIAAQKAQDQTDYQAQLIAKQKAAIEKQKADYLLERVKLETQMRENQTKLQKDQEDKKRAQNIQENKKRKKEESELKKKKAEKDKPKKKLIREESSESSESESESSSDSESDSNDEEDTRSSNQIITQRTIQLFGLIRKLPSVESEQYNKRLKQIEKLLKKGVYYGQKDRSSKNLKIRDYVKDHPRIIALIDKYETESAIKHNNEIDLLNSDTVKLSRKLNSIMRTLPKVDDKSEKGQKKYKEAIITIKKLLKAGATLGIKDRSGPKKTPYQYAKDGNHTEILELFAEHEKKINFKGKINLNKATEKITINKQELNALKIKRTRNLHALMRKLPKVDDKSPKAKDDYEKSLNEAREILKYEVYLDIADRYGDKISAYDYAKKGKHIKFLELLDNYKNARKPKQSVETSSTGTNNSEATTTTLTKELLRIMRYLPPANNQSEEQNAKYNKSFEEVKNLLMNGASIRRKYQIDGVRINAYEYAKNGKHKKFLELFDNFQKTRLQFTNLTAIETETDTPISSGKESKELNEDNDKELDNDQDSIKTKKSNKKRRIVIDDEENEENESDFSKKVLLSAEFVNAVHASETVTTSHEDNTFKNTTIENSQNLNTTVQQLLQEQEKNINSTQASADLKSEENLDSIDDQPIQVLSSNDLSDDLETQQLSQQELKEINAAYENRLQELDNQMGSLNTGEQDVLKNIEPIPIESAQVLDNIDLVIKDLIKNNPEIIAHQTTYPEEPNKVTEHSSVENIINKNQNVHGELPLVLLTSDISNTNVDPKVQKEILEASAGNNSVLSAPAKQDTLTAQTLSSEILNDIIENVVERQKIATQNSITTPTIQKELKSKQEVENNLPNQLALASLTKSISETQTRIQTITNPKIIQQNSGELFCRLRELKSLPSANHKSEKTKAKYENKLKEIEKLLEEGVNFNSRDRYRKSFSDYAKGHDQVLDMLERYQKASNTNKRKSTDIQTDDTSKKPKIDSQILTTTAPSSEVSSQDPNPTSVQNINSNSADVNNSSKQVEQPVITLTETLDLDILAKQIAQEHNINNQANASTIVVPDNQTTTIVNVESDKEKETKENTESSISSENLQTAITTDVQAAAENISTLSSPIAASAGKDLQAAELTNQEETKQIDGSNKRKTTDTITQENSPKKSRTQTPVTTPTNDLEIPQNNTAQLSSIFDDLLQLPLLPSLDDDFSSNIVISRDDQINNSTETLGLDNFSIDNTCNEIVNSSAAAAARASTLVARENSLSSTLINSTMAVLAQNAARAVANQDSKRAKEIAESKLKKELSESANTPATARLSNFPYSIKMSPDKKIIAVVYNETPNVGKVLKHNKAIVKFWMFRDALITYCLGELRIFYLNNNFQKFARTKNYEREIKIIPEMGFITIMGKYTAMTEIENRIAPIDEYFSEKFAISHSSYVMAPVPTGLNTNTRALVSQDSKIAKEMAESKLKEELSETNSFAINPEHLSIMEQDQRTIAVFDPITKKGKILARHSSKVLKHGIFNKYNMAFSYSSGELRIWDLNTGLCKTARTKNYEKEIEILLDNGFITIMGKVENNEGFYEKFAISNDSSNILTPVSMKGLESFAIGRTIKIFIDQLYFFDFQSTDIISNVQPIANELFILAYSVGKLMVWDLRPSLKPKGKISPPVCTKVIKTKNFINHPSQPLTINMHPLNDKTLIINIRGINKDTARQDSQECFLGEKPEANQLLNSSTSADKSLKEPF